MTEDIYTLSGFIARRILLPSDKNWQPTDPLAIWSFH